MINLLETIIEIIKDLLPDRKDPIIVWLIKLITTVTIILLLAITAFIGIRDTNLGKSWGINTPAQLPKLSNKEYRDIQAVLYSFLLRMKESVPELRAVFFIAIFDKNGNINFADRNYDSVGVFTWFRVNTEYISFSTFDNVFTNEKRPYLKKLGISKECVLIPITKAAQGRYQQASPGFLSDRSLICPVPNNTTHLPFGGIVAYWINDPKNPSLDQTVMNAAENTAEDVGRYLMSRTDLELNKQ